MEIPVYDGTRLWRRTMPTAVSNWNAALANMNRAITLRYEEIAISGPDYRVDGGIVMTDSLEMDPAFPRQAEGNYTAVEGLWFRGFVHFFWDPYGNRSPDPEHGIAVGCHELGHCLMLPHVEDLGMAGFKDSVMTSYAVLTMPSVWDATNCMPGYPVANPPKKKKKRRKRR